MTVLMKDAIKPNLMQTLEVSRVNPAFLNWFSVFTLFLSHRPSLPAHLIFTLFLTVVIGTLLTYKRDSFVLNFWEVFFFWSPLDVHSLDYAILF